MPLYEYECNQCRGRVEIIQSFSDPPYAHCPKCGGTMKKLASAPAIQFKGSGFYKTDYPSKTSGSTETRSDTKSDSKSETKSDSKSETKPDTKSEKKSE
jgi:putative FmdB family regulatory protein